MNSLVCSKCERLCYSPEDYKNHMKKHSDGLIKLSQQPNSDIPQWICSKDDWAHDIVDSPGGQKCRKCNEFLDNLAIGFMQQCLARYKQEVIAALDSKSAKYSEKVTEVRFDDMQIWERGFNDGVKACKAAIEGVSQRSKS